MLDERALEVVDGSRPRPAGPRFATWSWSGRRWTAHVAGAPRAGGAFRQIQDVASEGNAAAFCGETVGAVLGLYLWTKGATTTNVDSTTALAGRASSRRR